MQKGIAVSASRDSEGLFYTECNFDGIPISTQVEGELDLIVENEDHSIRTAFTGWKAENSFQDGSGLHLSGTVACGVLRTRILIEVTYLRMNDHVVQKTVRLSQSNIPLLFYQVGEVLSPASTPERFWSFDNPNHKGGVIHGTYPAAGFITAGGLAAGFLTDAGHRNLWTQNVRRRPNPDKIGFTALREMADARMLEMEDGKIRLTFGCLSDYGQGEKTTLAPFPSFEWKMMEGCTSSVADEMDFAVTGDRDCGLYVPFDLTDGCYVLSCSYRSQGPVHMRIFRGTPESEVQAFHYQDPLPWSPNEWTSFEDSFYVSDTQSLPTLIKIWQTCGEGGGRLQIRNLRLIRHSGQDRPYHRLGMGQSETKKTFLFIQQAASIRDLRLASQLRLAEGLGFTGSDPEKVLFADMQMLTWITSHNDFTPLNVPSINYAPDMYNRDSFWSIAGVDDKDLSWKVFSRWGDTQTAEGCIGTIVTPFMGSLEAKGNDATCEWLWWALINRNKYNLVPPLEKIIRAFAYCEGEFDPEHSGLCKSHFVLGQNDVTNYGGDRKTSALSVNQGVWAVTLQVAKDLGLPVAPDWIDRAIAGYLAFYQEPPGYLVNDLLHPYAISTGDLMPEFVSLWLWGKPMLSDAAVTGTLERIPKTGDCAQFMGHVDNRYFTVEDIPCDPGFFWPNGIYFNGGSWMREEIMAYVCGLRHGWPVAADRILKRLEAEISLNDDEPFSHEFLPTDLTVPGCWWPSIRVFSWNVFVLTALEVAGMR